MGKNVNFKLNKSISNFKIKKLLSSDKKARKNDIDSKNKQASSRKVSKLKLDSKIGNKHIDLNIDQTGNSWQYPLYEYDPYYLSAFKKEEDISKRLVRRPPKKFNGIELEHLDKKGNKKDDPPMTKGFFYKSENSIEETQCVVLEQIDKGTFKVEVPSKTPKLVIEKVCDRMNLRFEWESVREFLARRYTALDLRYRNLYFKTLKEKIKNEELTKAKVLFPVLL